MSEPRHAMVYKCDKSKKWLWCGPQPPFALFAWCVCSVWFGLVCFGFGGPLGGPWRPDEGHHKRVLRPTPTIESCQSCKKVTVVWGPNHFSYDFENLDF